MSEGGRGSVGESAERLCGQCGSPLEKGEPHCGRCGAPATEDAVSDSESPSSGERVVQGPVTISFGAVKPVAAAHVRPSSTREFDGGESMVKPLSPDRRADAAPPCPNASSDASTVPHLGASDADADPGQGSRGSSGNLVIVLGVIVALAVAFGIGFGVSPFSFS